MLTRVQSGLQTPSSNPAPQAGTLAGMAKPAEAEDSSPSCCCSALLQRLVADSKEQDSLPLPDCWGFASAPPSLRQLLRQAGQRSDDAAPAPAGDGSESYVAALQASHSFRSNHSIAAMAGAYQISDFTNGLAGSLLAGRPPDSAAARAAQQSLRRTIDEAWSNEAVCRGVAHAKSGDEQAALGCYSTALELHPGNTDALVARGAALANHQQFEPAVRDFQAALALDPGNANAAKYLAVTQQHAAAAAAGAAAGAAAAGAGHQRGHQHKGHQQQQQSTPFSSGRQGGSASAEQQAAGRPESPRLLRHRQQHQQQEERERQQRPGRSRSRSRSRGRSSSPSSSSCSGERDGGRRSSHQHQQRPSVADIQHAIEVLRSAKRGSSSKKKRKADGHKGSSSSKKHKHKHGSSSKAKGKRSSSKKHTHKKARHRHSSSSGGDSSSRSSGDDD